MRSRTELDTIEDRLYQLEVASSALDPSASERGRLLQAVNGYADRFLDGLDRSKAYETAGYDRTPEDAAFAPVEQGKDIHALLQLLAERVDGIGLNPASGGHLGYIPGGGLPASAMGDYLADIFNRYSGVFYAGPGAVRLENALIQWTGEVVGYPKGFGGNIASGGSMANLIALATARHAKGIKGKDLERTVVYLTSQTHHSLRKNLRIIGLDECIIRQVPVDARFRMDAEALEKQVQADQAEGLLPFLLIANAGSTDVGAVDPLYELGKVARGHGLWFHVDGAYGGYFLLTEHGKRIMVGVEQADSFVLDPHKGLFLPYGAGIVLVKDVNHLLDANGYQASYMQDAAELALEHSPADLSPEMSRHFRGLRMWLPLKLHGVAPFRAALEEKLWLTRYFHQRIQALGFEVTPEPDLSVMAYRFAPPTGDADAFNKAMAHAIVQDGRVFISTTVLNGQVWLRLAVLSFRTHKQQIDLLLEQLEAFVRSGSCS